jgi:hypothetical protein
MASLSGTTPQATYPSLIKFDNNAAISAALRLLSDGAGNATPMFMSSTQINIGGTGTINSTLGIKGTGITSATFNFITRGNDGISGLSVTDNGLVNWSVNGGAGGGQLNGTGVTTYELNSAGGFGNSRVRVDGVMDLHSNDGTLGIRVNNAFTGITDATAIGQTTAPVASAMLELVSTTKGLLSTRMTTIQKNAIVSPAAGLVVYDTTTNKLCCYNGTIWNDLF